MASQRKSGCVGNIPGGREISLENTPGTAFACFEAGTNSAFVDAVLDRYELAFTFEDVQSVDSTELARMSFIVERGIVQIVP